MRETSTLRAAITRAVAAASTPADLGELFALLGDLDAGVNEVAARLNEPDENGQFYSVARLAEHAPVSSRTIWNRLRAHKEGRAPRTVR